MAGRRLLLLVLLPCVLLTGCYSLVRINNDNVIREPGGNREIVVRSSRLIGHLGSQDPGPADLCMALLAYPLDVLVSAWVAVNAPFSPKTDVAWGPFGAVAGIVLPGVTLFPGLAGMSSDGDVEVDRATFFDLLYAVQSGKAEPSLQRIPAFEGRVIIDVEIRQAAAGGVPRR